MNTYPIGLDLPVAHHFWALLARTSGDILLARRLHLMCASGVMILWMSICVVELRAPMCRDGRTIMTTPRPYAGDNWNTLE